MAKTLIVTTIYTKPEDETPPNLVQKICGLGEISDAEVLVIAQGKEIGFPSPRVRVEHVVKPLGIWGALRYAYPVVTDIIQKTGVKRIAHNLAPLYYGVEAAEDVLSRIGLTDHTVGCRDDIASSLTDNPSVGKARALMECYLTALAGIVICG